MDTAFWRRYGGEQHTTRQETEKRAWMYVGRFMWGFGEVEAVVNEIFTELFQVDGTVAVLLLGNLDLRRKLLIIEVVFKKQQLKKHIEILGVAHKLHDIRNAIAHSAFGSESNNSIAFYSYVNARGEPRIPHRPKTEPESDPFVITYSEFDSHDNEAARCHDYLYDLQGSLTPITDLEDDDLRSEIAMEMGLPENVIPFPKIPPKDRSE